MYLASFIRGLSVKFPLGTQLKRVEEIKPGDYVLLYDFFGPDPELKTGNLADIDIYTPVIFLYIEKRGNKWPDEYFYLIPKTKKMWSTNRPEDFYHFPKGFSFNDKNHN